MKGFLIDLDGTLYRGHEPIPHAAAFIQWLQQHQMPFLLVTNNSSRTPEQVAEHLLALGIEVPAAAVYTSSQAAAQYLTEQRSGNRVHIVGEAGLRIALAAAGFASDETTPDYVVQGIDRSFSYEKLTEAVRHVKQGATYVLTNPDRMLPSDGGLMPGAGSLAAAITAASGVEPVVIGKPSPIIMAYATERLGLPPADVWVIGDNVHTDIRGGAVSGCRTALVLTGVATADNVHEQVASAGVTPDLICSDLQHFMDQFKA
ncbi:TIGR01457 family HAD-type hydrolase [Paenibacillus alba]|uniref:Acid sugar phosphatase n=1 Tax=Paenibacillus alba TaxID=1197127 RepID=A0ABU6GD15_9BACL|nr:TIGR01457 family HAD-type hydrolase [Paenibacillus alba]MEC0232103.1 TIGR01457 family HAD-type hydrolase [Paenibacillus alba]NQX68974.1 TIGR01457 family HAD-type hydrolase [Paenibacillus alba]